MSVPEREVSDPAGPGRYSAVMSAPQSRDPDIPPRALEDSEAALRRVDEELETLRYAIAHDLRAPLRTIDGFTRSVLEAPSEGLSEEARADLERVRAAAVRMGRLIDDLARMLGAARTGLQVERVDLTALAETAAQALWRSEPDRRVTFAIEPGVSAHGDRRLLGLALEQLLGNAWKFTRPHPTARIAFETTTRDGARGYVVRDDGVGYDPAYGAKLFTAFQRLHPTSEFEGSGIGLALVRRIVHRHRGTVWAEGALERGAAFGFTLGTPPEGPGEGA